MSNCNLIIWLLWGSLYILQELQRVEQQAIPFNFEFYKKLKPMMVDTVKAIRSNSSRISVRQELAYLDKYTDETIWQCISPVNNREIKLHIAHLVEDTENANQFVKAFDGKMLNIEYIVNTMHNVVRVAA